MTEIAARKLYLLIVEMNVSFARGSGDTALKSGKLGKNFADLISNFSFLLSDTREEIMRANFQSEGRVETLIDRLDSIRVATLNALSKRGAGGTTGPIVTEVITERAQGIAEQIENAGVKIISAPSRADMISETESLISEVQNWEIGIYAKDTLIIQLNNIVRVIQAADTYSSGDLRVRVKSIIADFASEFSDMDKKHQTYLERLVLWGRRGFFAGTVLLGLTADIATISAALPSPNLMIGKQ